jgi:dolichyl-phosphate-mannose-protein mannosyltransferase
VTATVVEAEGPGADPADAAAPDGGPRRDASSLAERLWPPMPSSGIVGWIGPSVVMAVGGIIRWAQLGRPDAIVFDETYYLKDALSLLRFGYERQAVEKANEIITAGDGTWQTLDVFKESASFVVHPPFGKWTIAAGEWLFGVTPFGWRAAVALLGTLSILMVARITRRLTRSDLIGTVAGLLLAVDGIHIVMSRTAVLDMVLSFWVLAAFGCLLLDRDRTRRRLARLVDREGLAGTAGQWGPSLGLRPWRWAAGVCLGLALGVKWSGLWFIAAFGLMTVLWDVGTRRAVGVRRPWAATLLRSAPPAVVSIVVVAAGVYLLTWSGWFLTDGGWDRTWADGQPDSWIPGPLRSLAHYHQEAWNFHVNLTSDHSYQSNAWSWVLQTRPTSFFYESYDNGQNGCTVDQCSAEVVALGNPIIWWAGALALLHQVWRWAARRDWRAGAVLVGVLAGWAPWLLFQERTIFTFYAVAYVPFVVMALALTLGTLLGRSDASPRRRMWGAIAAGGIVLAAVFAGWWFYPVWTGETIPYEMWRLRMWMPTWV